MPDVISENTKESVCQQQNYASFLLKKQRLANSVGFEQPDILPSKLFDWQASIVRWAIRKGRAAVFADCGL